MSQVFFSESAGRHCDNPSPFASPGRVDVIRMTAAVPVLEAKVTFPGSAAEFGACPDIDNVLASGLK